MSLKKIISFGFRHPDQPKRASGVVVVDVRKMFRNPYHSRLTRDFRGTDEVVQREIMRTPQFEAKVDLVRRQITMPGVEIAYIGCTGGHHRSVFLAELLSRELRVMVEHRDIDKE